jgi:acetyltransferase-like isoleucine patch superfamily enzyme/acyl carrier protein
MRNGVATQARRPLRETVSILASFARASYELRGTRRGARVRCFGALHVPQRRGVTVGDKAVFLGGPISTCLRCAEGAELFVGERTVCNYGVEVAASTSVRIGRDCMIASLVHIRDDDGRRAAPVVIGDGVWIAYGAVIEPGSMVGDGAVVATMSVVSGVVPPRSLAAGNPARCLPLDRVDVAEPGGDEDRDGDRWHAPDEVRGAIFEWLDDTRLFGDAEKLVTSDTQPLRESGLLDSLGTVELLLALEKRFGVAIDRARAAHTQAQTVKAFVELVTQSRPRAA